MLERLDPPFKPGWRQEWRDAAHSGFELLARLNAGTWRAQAEAETNLLMRQFFAARRESERTTSVTLRRTSYWAAGLRIGVDGEMWLLVAVLVGAGSVGGMRQRGEAAVHSFSLLKVKRRVA